MTAVSSASIPSGILASRSTTSTASERGPRVLPGRVPSSCRAAADQRVLTLTVVAPSTLGTFRPSFTFAHISQLDAVLPRTPTKVWRLGAGPVLSRWSSISTPRSAKRTATTSKAPPTAAPNAESSSPPSSSTQAARYSSGSRPAGHRKTNSTLHSTPSEPCPHHRANPRTQAAQTVDRGQRSARHRPWFRGRLVSSSPWRYRTS